MTSPCPAIHLRIKANERKHGEASIAGDLPPFAKLAILMEELGEVSRALQEQDAHGLREELTDLAAACHMWLGSLPPDPIEFPI